MRFSAKFNACVLAVSLLGAMPLMVNAAGFGRMAVKSNLGEPFRAEVDLLSVADGEALRVQFASMDTYQARQVEYPYFMTGMRVSVQKRPNGQPYALITSSQSINEPVVDLLLELKSDNGTVSRQYTSLLDPAEYQTTQTAQEEWVAPPVSPSRVERPTARVATSTTPAKVKSKKTKAKLSAAASGSAGTYTVQQGETLMQVARLHRPEGVSLDRMVKALYQYNQGAFVGGNINRLRSGTRLNIPATVNGIQTVKAENFDAYQSEVAQKAQTQAETKTAPVESVKPSTKVSGTVNKIKTSTSKSVPVKDVVVLTPPVQAGNAAGAAGKPSANAQAGAAAAGKTSDAAGLAVKNPALAAASNPAANPSTTASVAAPAASAPAPVAASVAAKASAGKASVPSAASSAASAAKPARVVDDSSLLDNPLVPAGGVAALLGIGALAFFMRRKKQEKAVGNFEDSILTGANLSSNTVLGAGGGVVDTAAAAKPSSTLGEHSFLTDFSREGLGNIDTDEVDPIAESEVYLAYGRADQAEEILKDALAKDGSRHDVRAKLLEIYAINKDKAAFAAEALTLQQGVGAHHPLWTTAAHLGRTIDSENALYQVSMPMTMSAEPVVEMPATTAHDLDFDLDDSRVAEMPDAIVGVAAQEKASPLDFDFDLAPSVEPSTPVAPVLADKDISLDLSMDTVGGAVSSDAVYDTSSIFADDDFEEDDTPSLIDPVDTKLDLASAYITMNDNDSAKEILEEVLKEGNPSQKAAAQQLLSGL